MSAHLPGLARERAGLVPLHDIRVQLAAGELVDRVPQGALLVGQVEIHRNPGGFVYKTLTGMSSSRHTLSALRRYEDLEGGFSRSSPRGGSAGRGLRAPRRPLAEDGSAPGRSARPSGPSRATCGGWKRSWRDGSPAPGSRSRASGWTSARCTRDLAGDATGRARGGGRPSPQSRCGEVGLAGCCSAERSPRSPPSRWTPRPRARGAVVRGRQYARELLRREAVARLMGDGRRRRNGLKSELAANGAGDPGLQLTQEAYEALAAVDLDAALVGFAGSSLLVGISPSGEPGRRSKARDRLVELGGDVTVTGIADPLYAPGRVLLPRGGPAETGHPARARSEGRRRRRRLGARPCGSVRSRMREFPSSSPVRTAWRRS